MGHCGVQDSVTAFQTSFFSFLSLVFAIYSGNTMAFLYEVSEPLPSSNTISVLSLEQRRSLQSSPSLPELVVSVAWPLQRQKAMVQNLYAECMALEELLEESVNTLGPDARDILAQIR
jgi:hypothetical protein